MSKNVRPLTALEVAKLSKPGLNALGGVPGLYLYIKPGSLTQSYVYRFSVQGTGERAMIGLGSVKSISLSDARKLASEARNLVLRGGDPREQRRAKAAERIRIKKEEERQKLISQRTVDYCADEFISERDNAGYWKNNVRGESVARAYIRNHISPTIGNIPISNLTAADVFNTLKPLWQSTTDTGRNCRSLIFHIFRWAKARGWCSGENPADLNGVLGVLLEPHEINRKQPENLPALDFHEIPRFLEEILEVGTVSYLMTAFSIVTVLRSKMVRLARWSDIDFEARTLTIPQEHIKTKKSGAHTVFLSRAALLILKKTPRVDGIDFIFPSPLKLQPLSDAAMGKVFKDMHERRFAQDGIGWVDHVLSKKLGKVCIATQHGTARAGFKTWARTGENRKLLDDDAVELCMAHRLKDDYGGAYNRTTLEKERRLVMEEWGKYCLPVAYKVPPRKTGRKKRF